jgi:hypothetical protein
MANSTARHRSGSQVNAPIEYLCPTGEQHPIGKSKAGPFDLSPQDVQLMSEHDYLEILAGLALALRNEQPEQHPNHQVHER